MKRVIYAMLIVFAFSQGMIQAQQGKGKVVDGENQPIEGVAVVMQTLDSVYVDAILTDSLGVFLINQSVEQPHRLLFQHLLYEPFQKEIISGDVGPVQLISREYELGEIVVKGERPVVRMEGGALSYDVPQLIKNKTTTNAFEAIKELPGITGGQDEIGLVGAGSLHIIINGQLSTLSLEQLIQLLKSIPADRVRKAEVMYNAPAKYNVNGALINVVIDQEVADEPVFQGEAGMQYTQKHYESGKLHTNLLYSSPRFSVDFLIDATKGRSYAGEELLARHTLDEQMMEIQQTGRSKGKGHVGTARLGLDYTFSNKDKLSAAYYLNIGKHLTDRYSVTTFTPLPGDRTSVNNSLSELDDRSTLQNVRLQFDGHAGLMAGADYTYYHSPLELNFRDAEESGTEVKMRNNSKQDVSRYSVFANQTHTLGAWNLNYGIQGGYAQSDNYLEYFYDRGEGFEPDLESLEDNTQKDYTANVFAEAATNFGSRFTASVALKTEYFKSEYRSLKEKKTLWNEWTLFPTVSLSYTFTPYHIMQLNVNSDKRYPNYSELTPQRYPLNSYSDVMGNPSLKPYRIYEAQLMYILRQKYIFMVYGRYKPDYFTQVPYQSDTELKNVFRFENFDYSLETGAAVIIPFRVGSFWDSRVTLTGFRMQEKLEHFYSMSFDREGYVGAFVMNNTFNLSNQPNIKLTIDGQYVTPGAIQGIYDLGYLYQISAGLKWTFANDQASLTLNANDIFQSGYPNPIEINVGNQWSRMKKVNDVHYVRLSFVYKFGGYKKKEYEEVDRSRF